MRSSRTVTLNTMAVTAVMAALAALAMLTVAASPAHAAFGDNYGVLDVNGPGQVSAPAYPGSKAYWAGTCDLAQPQAAVGVAPANPRHCIDTGTAQDVDSATNPSPWTTAPTWRLAPVAQAGAHPDATAAFYLRRGVQGQTSAQHLTDGLLKNTSVDLPPGVIGNPTATPRCPAEVARTLSPACSPASQVGIATILTSAAFFRYEHKPIYNVESRDGKAAEFLIAGVGDGLTNAPIVAKLRSDGDFGVSTLTERAPGAAPVNGVIVTLWGVPWDPSHDRWRPATNAGYSSFNTADPNGITENGIPKAGLPESLRASYDSSWGPVRPFFSNPTSCDGVEPVTSLITDSWQKTGVWNADGFPDLGDPNWKKYDSSAPPVEDCDQVPFSPSVDVQSSSSAADSASGLSVDIGIPQSADPDTPSTSHLKDTVVTLPQGLSVNPSGATGLEGCSDAQVGLRGTDFPAPAPARFTNDDPFDGEGADCPDGSKIGTVEVTTPVLDEQLTGEVVLGEPKSTDPQSGEMFRLFLVIRNKDRGLLAKIYGTAVADSATGQLTATFKSNPQLPFSDLKVDLKDGDRGLLATPQRCNTAPDQYRSVSTLLPWARAHLDPVDQDPVVIGQDWTIDSDCGYGFNPSLNAGMSNPGARQGGAFSFELTRPQGDQWLQGLTAQLPTGLLASIKDVPLCTSAQAAAGDCPAASRIGLADASAGSGNPFVLEQKGDVYLTEGYKGGPYGLLVKIRAIAGPFRGAMELAPIVVRQKIEVDPTTAQVRAVSDPFPTVWHGVPLRVRRVLVNIDRAGFMVNPSDCSTKEVGVNLTSTDGTVATRANRFQATGCASLPFKPTIALQAIGRNQVRTGTHPAIKATVTQTGIGEAGIRKAVVRLPKSLALDPENAQALCEFEDGTKPDLENHCPAGSIVGRARAKTPLLKNDLVGNVYFVKNVRKDPTTGNLIRTLPMIVVALRGEIAVNLKGESSTTGGGKLVNTFASVPDAPISQFNLNIAGGKNGILAVTRTRKAKINLCASRQIAEADTDGHNGRQHDFDARIKTPCTKAQTNAAKRKAKRAAAKTR